MERAKTQLEQLQSAIASVARKTGISSATKLALIAPSMDQVEEMVKMEWWDATILAHKRYMDPELCVLTWSHETRVLRAPNLGQWLCMVWHAYMQ